MRRLLPHRNGGGSVGTGKTPHSRRSGDWIETSISPTLSVKPNCSVANKSKAASLKIRPHIRASKAASQVATCLKKSLEVLGFSTGKKEFEKIWQLLWELWIKTNTSVSRTRESLTCNSEEWLKRKSDTVKRRKVEYFGHMRNNKYWQLQLILWAIKEDFLTSWWEFT